MFESLPLCSNRRPCLPPARLTPPPPPPPAAAVRLVPTPCLLTPLPPYHHPCPPARLTPPLPPARLAPPYSPPPARFAPPPCRLACPPSRPCSSSLSHLPPLCPLPSSVPCSPSSLSLFLPIFIVVSRLIHVDYLRRCFEVSFRPGGRVRGVSKRERKLDRENEPRQMPWLVFRHTPQALLLDGYPSSSSLPRSSVE